MPPVLTSLLNVVGTDTDARDYTTAAVSPTPGSLLVAAVRALDLGAQITTPTCSDDGSGGSLTWTAGPGITSATSNMRLQLFIAYADPVLLAIDSSIALTFAGCCASGQTCDGAIWTILQAVGCDAGFSAGFGPGMGQAGATDGSTGDSATPSLGTAAKSPNSLMIGVCSTYDSAGTAGPALTVPTGWNAALTNGIIAFVTPGDSFRLTVSYLVGTDLTSDWTANNTNDLIQAAAIELVADDGWEHAQHRGRYVPNEAVHRASRW